MGIEDGLFFNVYNLDMRVSFGTIRKRSPSGNLIHTYRDVREMCDLSIRSQLEEVDE